MTYIDPFMTLDLHKHLLYRMNMHWKHWCNSPVYDFVQRCQKYFRNSIIVFRGVLRCGFQVLSFLSYQKFGYYVIVCRLGQTVAGHFLLILLGIFFKIHDKSSLVH